MTKRKKRTICWIVFIALAYFVSRPMYYPGVGDNPNTREESIRLLQKGNVLSLEETDRFLITWSELLEKDFNNDEIMKLLTSSVPPRRVISSRARRWLEFQGWDIKRFFFVGRRLHKIIEECHKRQKIQVKRDSLEQQLNITRDEGIIGAILSIINDDNKLLDNIAEEEINIVMPKLDIIDGIVKGKLAYRPEN